MAKYPNIPNIYYSHKELKSFGLHILVLHEILENIVLNIFKYIFSYKWIKNRKKKKLNYSQRFLNCIKRYNDLYTLKLYKLKALIRKNL